jgi:hypothetical protein
MAKPTAAFLFAAKLAMDAGGEASMPFPAPVSARSAPFLAWPSRRDFMNYAYDNPVWRAARATGRFFDGATDPKNVGNELSAGVNAASAGDGGAAPAAAPAPAPAPEKPPQFEPGAMHYGLGGAGAGALLGAAMGRKGTRGRNALIGGALGGGAGLLAQHLMNKNSAQNDINVNDIPMGEFAGGTGAAGAALGGIAGLAGGGLAGLISPGEYEEDGVMKRRGRLMGALRGAGKGGLVGAVGGGAMGAAGGAGLLGLARIMQNTAHPPRVPQDKTALDKFAFDPRPVDQTVDGGGAIQTPIASSYLKNMQRAGTNMQNAGNAIGAAAAPVGRAIGGVLGGDAGRLAGGVAGGMLGSSAQNQAANTAIEFGARDPSRPVPPTISNNRLTTRPAPSAVKGYLNTHQNAQGFQETENYFQQARDRFQRIKGSHAVATKSGAFDFGQMLNQAGTYAKDMYNKVPESVRSGAGMGGIGGAALGGLAGLVAPGENVEYDEMGREVKRNPRSRFGAMMRGAVGGGLAGAAGGAAAGHFAPQPTQQAADYLRQQGHNLHQKYLMSQMPKQELPAGPVA